MRGAGRWRGRFRLGSRTFYVARCDFEGVGHVGGHVFDDAVFAAAEDGIVGAAHAEVGLVGGAVGEDFGVGGGDVGVGAEDEGAAAVEPVAHGDFFAGGFGVHVADADFYGFGELVEDAVGGGEGVVGGEVHEDSAEETEDADLYAGVGGDDGPGAAGGFGGEVGGADDALAGLHGGDDIEAAVEVVAQRDDVYAVGADFVEEVGGDAGAPGDIFGVGDDEVDGFFADEGGEFLVEDETAGAADDVAEAEDSQGHLGLG